MKRTDAARYEVIYDKIMRHFNKGEDLPDELAGRVMRWKIARSYLLDLQPRTDYDVVQLLVEEFTISEGTAWNDVRDCKRFFGSMEQINSEFEKIRLRARIEKLAHTTNKDSVKAMCHANLIKLGGFDKPEEEEAGGAKQIILNLSFNPALVGAKDVPNLDRAVQRFLGEKAKKELIIEDVDFEDVPSADGTSAV